MYYPKDCYPPTSAGNSLIPVQSLLFMKDYRIIYRVTVLLLHSEELEQAKAIKRKEGGLSSRTVVFSLNKATGLKE